jgi:hypothetical protein
VSSVVVESVSDYKTRETAGSEQDREVGTRQKKLLLLVDAQ